MKNKSAGVFRNDIQKKKLRKGMQNSEHPRLKLFRIVHEAVMFMRHFGFSFVVFKAERDSVWF